MSTLPIELLQLRASEPRSQLHRIASHLRGKIHGARGQLSLPKQARSHLVLFSFAAGLVGVAAGYGFAGLFTTSAPSSFELPLENQACRF